MVLSLNSTAQIQVLPMRYCASALTYRLHQRTQDMQIFQAFQILGGIKHLYQLLDVVLQENSDQPMHCCPYQDRLDLPR